MRPEKTQAPGLVELDPVFSGLHFFCGSPSAYKLHSAFLSLVVMLPPLAEDSPVLPA